MYFILIAWNHHIFSEKCSYKSLILYHYRIVVSEGNDGNKTSESKWFNTISIFLNKWFKFQLDVCKGCHDLLMMSVNISDIAILNIKGADYHCIISGICKNEAVNLLEKTDL